MTRQRTNTEPAEPRRFPDYPTREGWARLLYKRQHPELRAVEFAITDLVGDGKTRGQIGWLEWACAGLSPELKPIGDRKLATLRTVLRMLEIKRDELTAEMERAIAADHLAGTSNMVPLNQPTADYPVAA